MDELALVLPHDRHRLLTSAAAEHLRSLARRVVEASRAEVPLRAAILAGSAGRGDADYFSDLDLLLYVDALPPAATLDTIRSAVGGTNPEGKEATEHAFGQKFDLDGVRTELVFFTVNRIEWRLEQLRDRPEEVDGPAQKALAGLLHGLPLYGDDLVRRWQERLQEYPEALRRLLVQRHWQFLPLWYHHDEIAARDAELWRIDALLDAAFNLLAVLAAMNRIYFARVELKRTRALVDAMERAPAQLADRLESLFRLEPALAADELGRLVEETRGLVASEFPDLDFDIPFPLGTRKRAWAVEEPH